MQNHPLDGRPFGSLQVPTILQKPKHAGEKHQGRENPERDSKHALYVDTGSLIVQLTLIHNALMIAPHFKILRSESLRVDITFRPERLLINRDSTRGQLTSTAPTR